MWVGTHQLPGTQFEWEPISYQEPNVSGNPSVTRNPILVRTHQLPGTQCESINPQNPICGPIWQNVWSIYQSYCQNYDRVKLIIAVTGAVSVQWQLLAVGLTVDLMRVVSGELVAKPPYVSQNIHITSSSPVRLIRVSHSNPLIPIDPQLISRYELWYTTRTRDWPSCMMIVMQRLKSAASSASH